MWKKKEDKYMQDGEDETNKRLQYRLMSELSRFSKFLRDEGAFTL